MFRKINVIIIKIINEQYKQGEKITNTLFQQKNKEIKKFKKWQKIFGPEPSFIHTTRAINNNAIKQFKQELHKTSWDDVINNKNPNDAYNYFLHKLIVLYDKYFPKQNIRIYKKALQSPWITRGIKQSSKRKQKLYVKFLKNRNSKNELEYKNYKKFLSR